MKLSSVALEPSTARAELLDGIAALVREKTLLDLQLRAQLVRLWRDETSFGLRRFVSDELAIVLAESSLTTQRWVEDALLLEDHPEVKALVEQGRWTVRHADAVLDELAGSAAGELHAQVLELVLGQAAARTPHQLRKATRAAIFLLDPQAAQQRAEQAQQDRSVRVHDERDGSATLFMNGPKAAVAAALAGLDALCLPAAPEDDRNLTQRRFDTLLALITGERTAVGAHVQVLVSLATLQGADEPAEIPGLGFITAQEARDLTQEAAELRRIVVDEAGQLIGVDSTVTRPEPQLPPQPERRLTDQLEPEPVTDQALVDAAADLDHDAADEAWLAAVQDAIADPETAARRAAQQWADYCHPCPGAPTEAPELAAQAQLRQISALIAADGRPAALASILLDRDGTVRIHWPDPPDPDGGLPPPRPAPTQPWPEGFVDDHRAMEERDTGTELPADPVARARITRRQWLRRQRPSWDPAGPAPDGSPDPADQAPTLADLDWWQQASQPARALEQADLDRRLPATRRAAAPAGGWPSSPPPPARWSRQQLATTLAGLLDRPVSPLPPDSSSYPFTGRLARHLKTRDQTCRFPGCTRLAQHCDSDHRVPWPAGPTSISNGVSECPHHHQAKHALCTLSQLPDGTLRWTLTTGHHADAPPRALLRGW